MGRIRVLELIDQGNGISPQNVGLEGLPRSAFESRDKIRQQAVEGPDAAFALAARQFGAKEAHPLDPPVEPLGFERRRVGDIRLGETLKAFENPVLGGAIALRSSLLDLLTGEFHEFRIKGLAIFSRGRLAGNRARENRVDFAGPNRLDVRVLLGIAVVVENLLTRGFDQRRDRFLSPVLPLHLRRCKGPPPSLGQGFRFALGPHG